MAAAVTVVIPCLNEEGAIPGVLARIPFEYRAIVVDNGSDDATAEVAAAEGATVVHEPAKGYGAAVQAGIDAATTDVVAVLDGDGSMDPGELGPLVADVESGRADLAVGRRKPLRHRDWPLHARAGNALLAYRLRRRYGVPVHDIGAMRVARKQSLLDLGPMHQRFGYPLELLVRAGGAGWTVTEHDITYAPRTHGRSKVSGSPIGTIRVVADFWTVR